MNKSFFKRIISLFCCVGVLVGSLSVCNADSIADGQSISLSYDYASSDYYNYYIYDVEFIQFYGMPAGTYINGLEIRADMSGDSDPVCDINCDHDYGYYEVSHSGYHTYRIYNHSERHVSIDMNYAYF